MGLFRGAFSFNSSRHRLLGENTAFAAGIPAGALVLDAGAGDAPYRSLFEHAVYESADFEKVDKPYAKSTYVCDLRDIPVADGRFDYIVFNQVMEHLPEPKAALTELNRVLKVGGRMLYTGPLFYEEHEQPYDFYRYTQFGLRHLFASSGFSVERLEWLEGYFGTVGYQLDCMSRYLPHRPGSLGGGWRGLALAPLMVFLKITFRALSAIFHRLEIRSKFVEQGHPKNYIAILRKESS
jgi:SAM-dependent methyltransferase